MTHQISAGLPLNGLRVPDFTRVLAGPLCTMLLGDMGAEVIKIEDPRRGDDTREWAPFVAGWSTYYLGVNRNKKSVCIDLRSSFPTSRRFQRPRRRRSGSTPTRSVRPPTRRGVGMCSHGQCGSGPWLKALDFLPHKALPFDAFVPSPSRDVLELLRASARPRDHHALDAIATTDAKCDGKL
jgi:CoA-transferase family III